MVYCYICILQCIRLWHKSATHFQIYVGKLLKCVAFCYVIHTNSNAATHITNKGSSLLNSLRKYMRTLCRVEPTILQIVKVEICPKIQTTIPMSQAAWCLQWSTNLWVCITAYWICFSITLTKKHYAALVKRMVVWTSCML